VAYAIRDHRYIFLWVHSVDRIGLLYIYT